MVCPLDPSPCMALTPSGPAITGRCPTAKTPSPFVFRDPTPATGLVGRFINLAPQQLQTGCVPQTPPRFAPMDPWASEISAEFRAAERPNMQCPLSTPRQPPAVDWWLEFADAELRSPLPTRLLFHSPPRDPTPRLGTAARGGRSPVGPDMEVANGVVHGSLRARQSPGPGATADVTQEAEPPPSRGNGPPTAETVTEFISGLVLPIEQPLLQEPPRLRRSMVEVDSSWWVRRSERLAAKSAYRDPQPERQARRVMLNRWEGRRDDARLEIADPVIAQRFKAAFSSDAPASRREAMRELFP